MVMSLTRILQVYIIQGAVCLFFFFIGYKIIKRNRKKRLNQIFALYFLIVAASLVINFFYAPIEDPNLQELARILNIFTIYFIVLSMAFLLIFIMIVNKSEKIINTRKQILIIIIYAAILSVLFFIPEPYGAKVEILPDGTQLAPVWGLVFVIYTLTIIGITIGITYRLCVVVFFKFEDKSLQKKWRFFTLGMCFFWYVAIGTCINNFLNNETFRLIFGLTGIVIVVGAYLVYYGVGKQV